MENVFLDTNIFIDIAEGWDVMLKSMLSGSKTYLSISSIGIWIDVYKHKVPNTKFSSLFNAFNLVNITPDLAHKSLSGPTAFRGRSRLRYFFDQGQSFT